MNFYLKNLGVTEFGLISAFIRNVYIRETQQKV